VYSAISKSSAEANSFCNALLDTSRNLSGRRTAMKRGWCARFLQLFAEPIRCSDSTVTAGKPGFNDDRGNVGLYNEDVWLSGAAFELSGVFRPDNIVSRHALRVPRRSSARASLMVCSVVAMPDMNITPKLLADNNIRRTGA